MIAALCLNIKNEYMAMIYPVGTYERVDWNTPDDCELGEDYKAYGVINPKYEEGCSMDVAVASDGKYILRLTETRRYIVRLISNDNKRHILPKLPNEGKFLNCDRDENSLTFQFINYLGRSKLIFSCSGMDMVVPFEIVPDKIGYEDDYIELTEALAERCAELLLDYSGSTSNLYSISDNDSQTLLEQFIFLRKFCYSENIQALFESIKRNPDRILVEDDEMCPIGSGIPSKRFFIHPFQYSVGWQKYTDESGGQHFMPSRVAVTRKHDNKDTPANRFIKFALEKFDYICVNLTEALNADNAPGQTECRREARNLHDIIDNILRDSFFGEIGPLDVMPQNNQVLQKREGYSQIFAAYSMVDLALQLDWKGKDDVYEGESKNVALLYEYWLFFELGKVVASIDDCELLKTTDDPFFTSDKGRLTISLKEGEQSCQTYVIHSLGTRIRLYYNRSFYPRDFTATKYEGSYSRPFRPDYTLAIYPDSYCTGPHEGEDYAIRDGAVSYIHFDAKYRITNLKYFIGKVDNQNTDAEKREIEEEKSDEITNTYKRGDLLKMHTYNDAIRRTVGSYVLYPGDMKADDYKGDTYSLYDEILPGVGAFAIKPSISGQSEKELKNFVERLILERAHKNSRLNRIRYYYDMILREPSSDLAIKKVPNTTYRKSGRYCILGYIREQYYKFLYDRKMLDIGREFYFYYYAIKGNTVYSHHRKIADADFLLIFVNDIYNDGEYELEPIICSIESNELMSKEDLIGRLIMQGYHTSESDHHADFYYVMKVRVIMRAESEMRLSVSDINSLNGNDSFSQHSPKVVDAEYLGIRVGD